MSETALLPEPKFLPELHPTYRPAILANQAFRKSACETNSAVDVGIALEPVSYTHLTLPTKA